MALECISKRASNRLNESWMEEVTSEPVVLVCVRRRGEFPVPCCCLLRWFHDPALGDRLIRDLDLVLRDLPRRDL